MKKQNETIKKSLICLFIFVLAFIFSLQTLNHPWKESIITSDSSVFIYIANGILNGLMPYRDMFDHKGPLLYLINVLGILINKNWGLWFIELLTLFVTFYFIYRIANINTNNHAGLISVLLSSCALFRWFNHGNFTEEYAMPFIAISLFIFSEYFLLNKINKFRLVVCGLSFGAICLLKINMIPLWIVMCLGVLFQKLKEKEYQQLGFFLKYFLLGVFIIVIPILLWLFANESFSDFINDYIVFNIKYAKSDVKNAFRTFLHFQKDIWTILFEITVIILLFKERNIYSLLNVFLTIFTFYIISSPGNYSNHYYMIVIPIMAYPFGKIGLFLTSCLKKIKTNSKIKQILIILTIGLFCLMIIWEWCFMLPLQYVKLVENDYTSAIVDVSNYIIDNTNNTEQIIVCGNANSIYNHTNRSSASKYSFQYPVYLISEQIKENFYVDLEESKPKIIVLYDETFPEKDFLLDFIRKYNYELVLDLKTMSNKQILWVYKC